jgi:hypothetical protein
MEFLKKTKNIPSDGDKYTQRGSPCKKVAQFTPKEYVCGCNEKTKQP